ncbi:hypothetical protein AYJ54_06185 [Bradyrhizobium centrolobii]|uniref:Uncharacterized protein n=1 Tax=Bradyrhizobium centrolobii TaxID=1505087 RepID=A0A176YXI6_9BRAD|nr:hypothetical protein [Bradyrhizobium centrolobii]OAF12413.1 hypothetical protein AYJ54_06185 [Bradyrhizobium centrolobii]
MPVDHPYLNRILAESSRIRELVAQTHQLIATTRELLSAPAPNSFLGRKTQDPFPKEKRPSLLKPLASVIHPKRWVTDNLMQTDSANKLMSAAD